MYVGLRKAVAIPSVSADEERRPDVVKVSYSSRSHHNTLLIRNSPDVRVSGL